MTEIGDAHSAIADGIPVLETGHTREIGDAHSPTADGIPVLETGHTRPGSEKEKDTVSSSEVHVLAVAQASPTGVVKNFGQRLLFWTKQYASFRDVISITYRPLLLMRFPVVFW